MPSINAWAASSQDGTIEYLSLGYDTSVYAAGVMVVENWGNGFVTQLELKSNTAPTLDAANKVKGDIARQEPDTEAADAEEKEPVDRC